MSFSTLTFFKMCSKFSRLWVLINWWLLLSEAAYLSRPEVGDRVEALVTVNNTEVTFLKAIYLPYVKNGGDS